VGCIFGNGIEARVSVACVMMLAALFNHDFLVVRVNIWSDENINSVSRANMLAASSQ
jgi:hypothetical protein